MSVTPSWLAVVVLLVGVVSFVTAGLFGAYRERPGGSMWLGVLLSMALWSTSYGVGLFVFDPAVREWFEYAMYVAASVVGVFYLGFALEYTGHSQLNRLKWLSSVGGLAVGFATLVVTNPIHGLFWTEFVVDPVFGAATVTYARGPLFYALAAFVYACLGVGVFFLVETLLRYGRPYRTHLVVLTLTPLFPAAAGIVWLFELGPLPRVNLVPLAFFPHVLLDVYALTRSEMFEYEPATRRAGERAAIDDLAIPVFVFDAGDRLIDWNTAASDFGDGHSEPTPDSDERLAVGVRAERVLGLDEMRDEATIRRRVSGRQREFKLTVSSFDTAAGVRGGHTVALQDVTEENQRKQRLEVLNRILRHNVRNKCNVIEGHAEIVEEQATDDRVAAAGSTVRGASTELATLGEKARASADALDGDAPTETVGVRSLIDTDLDVDVDVPDGLSVETKPKVVSLVVSNLVENGLEHGDGRVRVIARAAPTTDQVVLEIRDEGDGIPEYERAVIETGEESPLDHGSGIGLWIVRWGTATVGGELGFDTDGGGTTVRLRLPGLVDAGGTREDSAGGNERGHAARGARSDRERRNEGRGSARPTEP
jgi:signal transduction histidine kinase